MVERETVVFKDPTKTAGGFTFDALTLATALRGVGATIAKQINRFRNDPFLE